MFTHLNKPIDEKLMQAAREGNCFVINGFINSLLGSSLISSQESLLLVRPHIVQLYMIAQAHNHTKIMAECLRMPGVKEDVVTVAGDRLYTSKL